MEDYIVEIDSSQRDPNIYSEPNDYSVYLNKHLYAVESIELVTGKIPTSQYLINKGNKQFQVDGTDVFLPEGDYANGTALAQALQTALASTAITSVQYQSAKHNLLFTGGSAFSFEFNTGSNGFSTNSLYGTPVEVLGMSHGDTEPTTQLESGSLNLDGPTNLIIKLSLNEEECRKDVYTGNGRFGFGEQSTDTLRDGLTNQYTGRINIFRDGGSRANYIDIKPWDPVIFKFPRGSDKSVDRLRIQWFYNVGNKLVPYDFRGKNHFIKLKIRGSVDKLSVLSKVELPSPSEEQVFEHPREEEPKIEMNWLIICFILAAAIFIWSRHRRSDLASGGLSPQSA